MTEYIDWDTIHDAARRVRDHPGFSPGGLVADYVIDAVHLLAPHTAALAYTLDVARSADQDACRAKDRGSESVLGAMSLAQFEPSAPTSALKSAYDAGLRAAFEALAGLETVEEAAEWAARQAVWHLTTGEHGVDYTADGVLRWRIHAALGSPAVRDPVKARAAQALLRGRTTDEAGALVGVSKAAISQAMARTARHPITLRAGYTVSVPREVGGLPVVHLTTETRDGAPVVVAHPEVSPDAPQVGISEYRVDQLDEDDRPETLRWVVVNGLGSDSQSVASERVHLTEDTDEAGLQTALAGAIAAVARRVRRAQ